MKAILLFAAVAMLSACAVSPNASQGEKAGTQAIVIARVNTLPVSSPVYLKVAQDGLLGPVGAFKAQTHSPLVVTTLEPGKYHWGDVLNVRYSGPVDVSGVLPPFEAKSGCITYIGDIRLDLTGPKARVSIAPPNRSTLSEFKARYTKMFEDHPVCR